MLATTLTAVVGTVLAAEATGRGQDLTINELVLRSWWQPLTTILGVDGVVVLTLAAIAVVFGIIILRQFGERGQPKNDRSRC